MVQLLYSTKMENIENKIKELNEHRVFSHYFVEIKETVSYEVSSLNMINKIYRVYTIYVVTLQDLDTIPSSNSNDLEYFAIIKGKETQEREEINYETCKIIFGDKSNYISKIIIEENGKEIIINNEECIFERIDKII